MDIAFYPVCSDSADSCDDNADSCDDNADVCADRAAKNVFLIFTGLGGSVKGYNDKYVKIAENVTKCRNFSVYVLGVPEYCWDNPQEIFEETIDYVIEKSSPENIYVMGSSAGANLAIWYSHLYPQIKKVLAVNAVLNLNLHKTRNGILNFSGEKTYVFIGENDPSAPYVGLLPRKDNAEYRTLGGVDHVFKGKTEEFIALPNILFE